MVIGHWTVALLFVFCALSLPGCQDPVADTPSNTGAGRDRNEFWRICQDFNRGLAAADACSELLASGQETPQRMAYIHYNRGHALGQRGRTQAAIADYDAALKLDPSFALAYYQRGQLYQMLGQSMQADMDLVRARQLDPRLP